MALILRNLILFFRNSIGSFNSPYITFRKLAHEGTDPRQVIFIFFLSASYFAFASLVRGGIRSPLLLTIKFNTLLFGAVVGFLAMVLFLYFSGSILRGKGTVKAVVVLWSYTLLPTVFWFFFTSFMYLLAPPPRTASILGRLYSIFFIAFSLLIFYWKAMLYYLTLRFGMRLDLFRIGIVSVALVPLLALYSVAMYKLGVFRIPFV